MDALQNSTKREIQKGDKPTLNGLSFTQEQYIDFCACAGLIVKEDGAIKKMTIGEFATTHGVDRTTLYNWQKSIPKFDQMVEKRRFQIFTKNRVAAVWNGVFLRAAKGDAEQAKMILGHYAGWQPPSQKHEVTVSGLGDLVNLARQKGIIEGEVVDDQPQQITPPVA